MKEGVYSGNLNENNKRHGYGEMDYKIKEFYKGFRKFD